MSGTTNPNIILGFRPTPNIGPDMGKMVADSQALLQFRQQQDQIARQNALMGIFKDPASLDKTGNPTPESLQKVMSVDPNAGMALRQNMMIGQERQLRTQALSSQLMADKMERIANSAAPILETYEQAIRSGVPEDKARRDGQASLMQANQRLAEGGGFTDDEVKRFPTTFDPMQLRNVVAGTKQYQEYLKDNLARAREDRQEKHDQANENTGQWKPGFGTDDKGATVPGMWFTPKTGSEPTFHPGVTTAPAGGGTASAAKERDAETIARLTLKAKTEPLTPDEQKQVDLAKANQQARNDPAVQAAAEKKNATARPEEITVDGKPQQGLWRDGKWSNIDGTPITGEVRLANAARADKREAYREADHLAIEEDVKREHPEYSPGQIATESKAREKLASTLPGSVAANRAAIAADVKADPAFQGKPEGELGAEIEHRYQVSRQATMDPEVAHNLARQYVATANVNVFSGFRRNTQMMNQIEKAVIDEQTRQGKTPEQVARGSADFAAYTQGVKAFEAGGKLEPTVRSQNVAVQHLDVLQTAADALNNDYLQAFNAVKNRVGEWKGLPAPTDFNGVKRIVGDELAKAILGSAGALGDRDSMDRDLNAANSPVQLRSLINRYKQLMAGQLGGLRQSYDRLETGKSFDERFLAPETQREIARYSAPPPVPPAPGGDAPKPGQQGAAQPAAQTQAAVQIPAPLTSVNQAGKLAHNADGTVFYNTDTKKYFGKDGKEIPAPGAAQQPAQPKPAEGHPVPEQYANSPDGKTFTSKSTGQKFVKRGDQIVPVESDNGDALKQAREAIKLGAPRDAVIKRLQDAGIDTKGL